MSAEPYVFVDPRDGNAEEEEELEQIRYVDLGSSYPSS
jgi:hypothetical protein